MRPLLAALVTAFSVPPRRSLREILRECGTDGLLIDAFSVAIEENNDKKTWQYVHQALLLQYCRMPGHDGINLFLSGSPLRIIEQRTCLQPK